MFHSIIGNESDESNMQLVHLCVYPLEMWLVGLVVDYTMCKKGEVVSPKVFRINWHLKKKKLK